MKAAIYFVDSMLTRTLRCYQKSEMGVALVHKVPCLATDLKVGDNITVFLDDKRKNVLIPLNYLKSVKVSIARGITLPDVSHINGNSLPQPPGSETPEVKIC